MERWFDEVHLSKHPIAEIGVAFYIREMMGNNCIVSALDLRQIFGENTKEYLDNLRRSGILKITQTTHRIILNIVAPGDKKRKSSCTIGRRKRIKRELCLYKKDEK